MWRGILVSIVVAIAMVTVTACGEDEDARDKFASDGTTVQATQQTTEGASTDASPTTEGGATEMKWDQPPAMALEVGKDYGAIIKTNKGEIVVDLYEADAPLTVNSFVFLAQQGYYANVPFHRVMEGFMIQTGDPTGTGAGGPGYRFQDELGGPHTYTRGTLAMANAGPNTNGSQFFICHADLTNSLPKNYTIFGVVSQGLEVVDAIAGVGVAPNPGNPRELSKPTEPVSVESIEITVN